VLYIVAHPFFLSEYLLDSVQDESEITVLLHPKRTKGIHRSFIKSIEAAFSNSTTRSYFFPSSYIDQLKKIRVDDQVLIFGIENLKELIILKRFIRASQVTLFRWNPIRDHNSNAMTQELYVRALKKVFNNIATFDPNDARDYGLKEVKQVYAREKQLVLPATRPEFDLFFVGQDKGRFDQIKRITTQLEKLQLRYHFHTVKDKHVRYSSQDLALLKEQALTYSDNLALIDRSCALLEILQSNQSGQTIRSLESAFLGKKLVTNNAQIIDTDLYDPNRVYLLKNDTLEGLPSFLEKPFDQPSKAILDGYDFKHWCRQFFD
jgi:hypothetical protein